MPEDLTPEQEAIKRQCFAIASRILGEGILRMLSTPPKEAAVAAHLPGGPTVEELEQEIRTIQEEYAGTAGKDSQL